MIEEGYIVQISKEEYEEAFKKAKACYHLFMLNDVFYKKGINAYYKWPVEMGRNQ